MVNFSFLGSIIKKVPQSSRSPYVNTERQEVQKCFAQLNALYAVQTVLFFKLTCAISLQ